MKFVLNLYSLYSKCWAMWTWNEDTMWYIAECWGLSHIKVIVLCEQSVDLEFTDTTTS